MESYLEEHFEKIKSKAYKRKYKPNSVKKVENPKENEKKRQLGIPTVMDRVLQQQLYKD